MSAAPATCRCGAAYVRVYAAQSRCADCLCGVRKVAKFSTQRSAVDALPPFVAPPGSWGFRVPGSPMTWNNALVRPRFGRAFLKPAAKEWKTAIGLYAVRARPQGWPLNVRVHVAIMSYFQTAAGDSDGPVKLVRDALKGIVYLDDRQAIGSDDRQPGGSKAPRLEVTIRVVE